MIALVAWGVLRGNADSAAKKYDTAAVSYLNAFADKINNSSSPIDANNGAKSLDRPKLDSVPMGASLSSEYKKAQDTQKDVDALADKTTSTLESYASVAEFNDKYNEILSKVQDLASEAPSTLGELGGYVDKASPLIDEATKTAEDLKAPEEIASAKADLVEALKNEKSLLEKIRTAATANDANAAKDALASFTEAASRESAALSEIKSFTGSVDSESLTTPLTDMANRLK